MKYKSRLIDALYEGRRNTRLARKAVEKLQKKFPDDQISAGEGGGYSYIKINGQKIWEMGVDEKSPISVNDIYIDVMGMISRLKIKK